MEQPPLMEPTIARPKPYLVTLKAGRTYWWCRCGRSKKQPFCDGSHAGTGFEPLKHVAQTDGEEVLFCGCKYTKTAPFCDGAHTNLPGGSPLDDPNSPANVAIPLIESTGEPVSQLDDTCYVYSPSRARMIEAGTVRYCMPVSGKLGSLYQSQFYLRAEMGSSPIMTFGDRDAILFISTGAGEVIISGNSFVVKPLDGLYVRPGEALQFVNPAQTPIEVFICISPEGDIGWLREMPLNFDERQPKRIISVDPEQRTAMGSRWFQVLVDKAIGSTVITQFIGHIPQSKSAPHRHLYEETIIVLSGAGCMWTENKRTLVRAGDVIFLPRKQEHSLQSTTPEGLDVVGVICPGDNPSINY